MKLIATVFNVLLLATAAVLLWQNGFPSVDDNDFWLSIMILLAPSCSLLVILAPTNQRGLAALYFQRKALEEEAKIAELKANARDARK